MTPISVSGFVEIWMGSHGNIGCEVSKGGTQK